MFVAKLIDVKRTEREVSSYPGGWKVVSYKTPQRESTSYPTVIDTHKYSTSTNDNDEDLNNCHKI